MNSVELLATNAAEKLAEYDDCRSATYVSVDGTPSYSRVDDDELTIEVVDGDQILTIVCDPQDPSSNIAWVDNLKTKSRVDIEPDRVEAFAEYMLSFVVGF